MPEDVSAWPFVGRDRLVLASAVTTPELRLRHRLFCPYPLWSCSAGEWDSCFLPAMVTLCLGDKRWQKA